MDQIGRTEIQQPENPPPVPDFGDKDNQAADFVRQTARECATAMQPLHRRWVTNKALRLGIQYHIWSSQERRLSSKRVPSYRERHVTNVVDPVVRTFVGQLMKNRPQWQVIPVNMDAEAIIKAQRATTVLDWLYNDNEMEERLQLVANWMFETGSGVGKVGFDPTGGPVEEAVDDASRPLIWPEGFPRAGMPMIDEQGNPLTFLPGTVDFEVISPFQMLLDPDYVGTIDYAPYIIHQTLKPLEWFEEQFPERGKYVTGNVNMSESLWLERQFTSLSQSHSRSGMTFGASQTRQKWAVYQEAWVRPSVRFPKGRLICMGGDVVLRNTDCPYLYARGARPDRDWHPFVHFKCLPIGGRFWPNDIIGNVHGIQKAINRIISDFLEVEKLLSKPKWMIPIGSLLRNRKLSAEPGDNVWYNPAYGPPHIAKPGEMPRFAFELLKMLFDNLDFVTLQHGPTRGQAPQGVKSGIGMALLQEQDEMDISPISKLWEHSFSVAGRKMLLRFGQFSDVERKIRLLGPNQEMAAFKFSGADLSSSFDVYVKAGSSLPKSRAATAAYVERLIAMGLYMPQLKPQDRRTVMEMLELGTAEERMQADRQDERRADMENILMKDGLMVPTEWFQNHDIHLERHISFMKTEEWQRLLIQDPGIEARMNVHILQHVAPSAQMGMQELGRMGMPGGPMPQQPGAGGGMGLGTPRANLPPSPGLTGLAQAGQNAEQIPQEATSGNRQMSQAV